MSDPASKPARCLNCNAPLQAGWQFCPACGQENTDRKVAFRQIVLDFLGDFFTFDSKFFRSLGPLIFRPGYLTKAYNRGKRVRFIPPLRLYIFISIVFFFLLSLDDKNVVEPKVTTDGQAQTATSDSLIVDLGDTTILIHSRDHIRQQVEQQGMDGFLDSLGIQKPFERFLGRHIFAALMRDAGTVEAYFLNNLSVMMFFLMPVLAALLKLVYRKRAIYYIEHLVFSFHFHAFFFLFQSVLLLAGFLFAEVSFSLVIIIVMPVYFGLAIHWAYGARWWKSLLNTLLLLPAYVIITGLFVIATLALSVMLL